jgi:hypothetical protein
MISAIRELVQFYSQQFHVPIECVRETWEMETWERQGLLVGMPESTDDAIDKKIDKLAFGHDPEFGKQLGGDLVVVHDLPMARIGTRSIVFLFLPTNKAATDLARKMLEERLPRMCRTYRHEMRDQLVTGITECVQDRKKELQSSIREDSYELERLSLQMMQLSRKLETDRQVLTLFEKAPEWICARATRTYVDLMKLVPGTYASFRIEDESVIGVTHDVEIEFEGTRYHFDFYNVAVDLRQGKIRISGGTNMNGYVHPHVTDENSICWGNVGHLVDRLVGELDLFGLFQLVHEFLTTYNASDPYQRIEKWDPDYEEPDDDEEPYCSWCDSYGHEISECESCWFCPHCDQYDDHSEEDCPNRPQQTEEVIHAVDETPA